MFDDISDGDDRSSWRLLTDINGLNKLGEDLLSWLTIKDSISPVATLAAVNIQQPFFNFGDRQLNP
jgi:hypothetical protein